MERKVVQATKNVVTEVVQATKNVVREVVQGDEDGGAGWRG